LKRIQTRGTDLDEDETAFIAIDGLDDVPRLYDLGLKRELDPQNLPNFHSFQRDLPASVDSYQCAIWRDQKHAGRESFARERDTMCDSRVRLLLAPASSRAISRGFFSIWWCNRRWYRGTHEAVLGMMELKLGLRFVDIEVSLIHRVVPCGTTVPGSRTTSMISVIDHRLLFLSMIKGSTEVFSCEVTQLVVF
jgi:hypothetical protein